MNKFIKAFIILCVVYLALSLVISPEVCITAGKSAISLCLDGVIPSLFPFLICSGLLNALGAAAKCRRYLSPLMRPLLGIPGSGAMAFILGIISGYPTGAVCAADLYSHGECTKDEAQRMTAFCNNSGPLFIIGVVGVGSLASAEIGKYLYLSHILSALITGIILAHLPKKSISTQPTLPPSVYNTKINTARSFVGVIDNSVLTMAKICAFVILFSVVGAVLPKTPFTPYIHSFLEITGGINALSLLECEPTLKLSLISFFIAFSGISVLLQVAGVITPCGLSPLPYLFGKLLQGVLSFVITYVLFTYFPITKDVFTTPLVPVEWNEILASSVICTGIAIVSTALLCVIAKVFTRY